MTLKQKIEYIKKNWSFIITDDYTKELLLSDDGKYIFHCKFQKDNFNAR